MTAVDGIILAAGLSTRLGRSKLTVEIGGIPVISRVIRSALDSALRRVILITGTGNSRLLEALGQMALDSRLLVAVNPHPEQGMSLSVRVGMELLGDGVSGAMLILADQPFLTAAVIDDLLKEFGREPNNIVAALVRGRRTNPVIFPAELFGELMEIQGDVGGRFVLNRHESIAVGVEMGDRYDDEDLDTADDLQRILKKAHGREDV